MVDSEKSNVVERIRELMRRKIKDDAKQVLTQSWNERTTPEEITERAARNKNAQELLGHLAREQQDALMAQKPKPTFEFDVTFRVNAADIAGVLGEDLGTEDAVRKRVTDAVETMLANGGLGGLIKGADGSVMTRPVFAQPAYGSLPPTGPSTGILGQAVGNPLMNMGVSGFDVNKVLYDSTHAQNPTLYSWDDKKV